MWLSNGRRPMLVGVAALSLVFSLFPSSASVASTPPIAPAVAKPDQLPLRLPWIAGEQHVLGLFRYNGLAADGTPLDGSHDPQYNQIRSDHLCTSLTGSQDCYALDVVGLTTSTKVVALFPGKVVFTGCASQSGGYGGYGQVVYIETRLGSYVYGALYAHLSSVSVTIGKMVPRNGVIGKAGGTTTVGTNCSPTGPGNQPGNVHLHFAIYQFDTANPSQGPFDNRSTLPLAQRVHKTSWWTVSGNGGPHGGKAVVPEPLIGDQVYENFRWWNDGTASGYSPLLRAVDLSASQGAVCAKVGVKRCKWLSTAGQTISDPAGAIQFKVEVTAPTGLKEVRLTAWFDPNGSDPPDSWAQQTPGWNLQTFTPSAIWPIVAVCRPPVTGFATQSDANGCVWSNMTRIGGTATGKVTAADIAYPFPVNAAARRVDWLPLAMPAWPTSGQCVPMKISFNIYDTAGGMKLAGDSVLPASCPASAASGSQPQTFGTAAVTQVPAAQVVYLRPAAPTPTPTPTPTPSPTIVPDPGWHPLGDGVSGEYMERHPQGIAVGADDTLYVSAEAYVDGHNGRAIRMWRAGGWSNIATDPANYDPVMVAAGGPDGTIFAAGNFTTMNATPANRAAFWNGSEWTALGTGLNGNVHALAVGHDGMLYTAGEYSLAGDATTYWGLAAWDGSSWQSLGGSNCSRVEALVVSPSGVLYADYYFYGGSGPQTGVCSYDGSYWHWIASPPNGLAHAMAVDQEGAVYVAYDYYGAAGNSGVSAWDGTSWSSLGNPFGVSGRTFALTVAPDDFLYAAGQTGGSHAAVARWSDGSWTRLGTALGDVHQSDGGCCGQAMSIVADSLGTIYVGGSFIDMNGVPMRDVGRWSP